MEEPIPERQRLGDLLIAAGAIEDAQLQSALAEQHNYGRRIGMTLVRMGFIDERTLVRALASQLGIPVVQLQGKRVNAEVLELVPVDLAEKHRCIPLLINGEGQAKTLYLGMEDPVDLEALDAVGFHVGMKVQAVVVEPSQLEECILRHYHWEATGGTSTSTSLRDQEETDPETDPLMTDSTLSDPAFDPEPLAPLVDGGGIGFDGDLDPEGFGGDELLPEPDTDEPLEFEASPSLAPSLEAAVEPLPSAPRTASTAGVSSDAMLRAIAQLLVEKGVFTRDELVERLRAVAGADEDG